MINFHFKDDNNKTIFNITTDGFEEAQEYFKKYTMNIWGYSPEDAEAEWKTLYFGGMSENGDTLECHHTTLI